MTRPVLWEELSWEQIAALRDGGMDMAILPVGATEQHGLHLPALCIEQLSEQLLKALQEKTPLEALAV